jgi:hypothetical protein
LTDSPKGKVEAFNNRVAAQKMADGQMGQTAQYQALVNGYQPNSNGGTYNNGGQPQVIVVQGMPSNGYASAAPNGSPSMVTSLQGGNQQQVIAPAGGAKPIVNKMSPKPEVLKLNVEQRKALVQRKWRCIKIEEIDANGQFQKRYTEDCEQSQVHTFMEGNKYSVSACGTKPARQSRWGTEDDLVTIEFNGPDNKLMQWNVIDLTATRMLLEAAAPGPGKPLRLEFEVVAATPTK